MVLNRLERTLSGFQCSCSPNSPGFRPASFHSLRPRRSKSLPVRNAAIIEYAEETYEPEAELLSKDLLEEKFAGKHGSHISKLQALERLKGDMRSALLDMEEPTHSFSESDREKLHLARQQHAIEERQAGLDALKEKRKEERAAKRAARKEAASRQPAITPSASDTAAVLDERSVTQMKSSVGDRMKSRRADKAVAKPLKPGMRGARAFATSRTRTQAAWGKQLSGKVEEEQIYLKSLGGANSPKFEPKNPAFGSYGDFLKSMPKHELLTYEEERALSRRVQDLVLLQSKFKELSKKLGNPPSNEEWANAFGMDQDKFNVRWKDGNRARSRMLTCNQRLVVSIALRYQDKGLDLTDLIAEGMTGLARSVEKYDYKKGFKFSTYATWWIRQAITRAIGDLSKTIRLPCHLLEILSRINKVEAEYRRKHNTFPDLEYVAKKLRLSLEKVQMVKQASVSPKLLDDPAGLDEDDGATFGETLEDNSVEEVQTQLVADSLHTEVNAVLNKLTPRECGILRMRYGLDDGQPKTLEEIGLAFKVTRERIRQIENKAMAKLKQANTHLSLRQFITGEAMESASDEVGWKANVLRAS